MRFCDAWRLMGPNLQTRTPAVLVEVALDAGEDPERAFAIWSSELSRMLDALGVESGARAMRAYRGGAAFTVVSPIDVLLPTTDAGEWAARSTEAILQAQEASSLEPRRTELAEALDQARNPALIALEAAARARGLPFLWDDESVSIGLGRHSRTWPIRELPKDADIPWSALARIPVAMITGTNGKTTSTRLVARMAREAGHVVGSTSTEGIHVGGSELDHGDYTGPMGARAVLRNLDVAIAILETARGGVLRRGLAVEQADAVLITNVSDDHLGGYGVDDVATMARVKGVLATVVGPTGRIVLNADDSELMALAPSFSAPISLFSLDACSAVVARHRAQGGEVWFTRDGMLIHAIGAREDELLLETEVPLTMNAAARYNVANALGAAALGSALGLPKSAIVEALRRFEPNADNPGRGNLFDVSGVTLLIDFGHNPKGVAAALDLATSLRTPTSRLFVLGGHAGDRRDEDIREVARAIHAAKPDAVWLRDLQGYLRGRAAGEVPAILADELLRLTMPERDITIVESEVEALSRALDSAKAGDVIALLVHVEVDGVRALLEARRAAPAVAR